MIFWADLESAYFLCKRKINQNNNWFLKRNTIEKLEKYVSFAW